MKNILFLLMSLIIFTSPYASDTTTGYGAENNACINNGANKPIDNGNNGGNTTIVVPQDTVPPPAPADDNLGNGGNTQSIGSDGGGGNKP